MNKKPEEQNAPSDGIHQAFTRFERYAWDAGGILLFALAVMTFIALIKPGSAGGLLQWWSQTLVVWFGWGSVWVVALIVLAGYLLLRHKYARDSVSVNWGRIIALELAAFTSLALLAIIGGSTQNNMVVGYGGRIGWGLTDLLRGAFAPTGFAAGFLTTAIFIVLFVVFFLVGLGLIKPLIDKARQIEAARTQVSKSSIMTDPAVSEAPLQKGDAVTLQTEGSSSTGTSRKRRTPVSPEFRKKFKLEPEEQEKHTAAVSRDDRLPPLDMLVFEKSARPSERNINQTAGLIEQTLAEFGIPAKVIDFQVGPTITQFAVEPGFVEKDKPGVDGDPNRHKVRVAQISALRRDLALALSAERLRIQAPVPGRPYVGIEVPNTKSIVVRLRPILESDAFYKINSPLTIGLGRNVSGRPVVADLGMMPHLLVAGATGSGKSVCIAAITTCLVMNNTPEDLRVVMVDPKMVELVRFNGLPHLIGKVETEIKRILAVLRWVVTEMDRRYKLLENSRSRNIDTYNRKAHRRKDLEPIPRLVVLIDELADLMMTAPDQTEHNLVRLAQMARATGIHLVLATQRPSTDVVTGLIKANFPARISFAVASSVDSRVILDSAGAESLLGRGDMLFLPPEASGPIRAQGVMVSDQEVERVITYWQKTIPVDVGEEPPPWDAILEQEKVFAQKDPLLPKAIEVVRKAGSASASMLQRRMRIGYPRAARLIDELEQMGVVGPAQGGGREREVFYSDQDDLTEAESL